MIAEAATQDYSSGSKYYHSYSVSSILEHVIDCYHTIVSDKTNPYHSPISWLSKKQPRAPMDSIFEDLHDECSLEPTSQEGIDSESNYATSLSFGIRSRLERLTKGLKIGIVNRVKDGCTPFFLACRAGHFRIVKYLYETCGADIEIKGYFESPDSNLIHTVSPLWVAAVSGHPNIVRYLIDKHADVNSLSDTGSTPLRSVCFRCKEDEHGGEEDIDEYNFGTKTEPPIDKYFLIAKLLINSGADINKSNNFGGTCLINSIHNLNLTKYLIDNGSSIDACDTESRTALHYAIYQGRLEVTKLLISSGANPHLRTRSNDDALQLSCAVGHVDIFKFLLEHAVYPREQVIDAYKLLGSSILELQFDLSLAQDLWRTAINLQTDDISIEKTSSRLHSERCDIKRRKAFSDMVEIKTEQELDALGTDHFRIQSLIMSERILGPDHKEYHQRLLYRGTSYMNSLRPDRCLDFWIYALNLKISYDGIFHIETICAAKAIARLFLDLLNQNQRIEYEDVFDLLKTLADHLEDCMECLRHKPIYCLHQDIFDILLLTMVHLLIILIYTERDRRDREMTGRLVKQLVDTNPRSSRGCSLLRICLTPNLMDDDVHKLARRDGFYMIAALAEILIENDTQVDMVDCDGLSALQVLCVSPLSMSDKRGIIKKLIEKGAHIDRKCTYPGRQETIDQALREAGINAVKHMTLSCLAARKLSQSNIQFDKTILSKELRDFVAIH